MKDETVQVVGELLDTLWLGIKIVWLFAVVWPGVVLILKVTPAALKALGVWP